MPTVPKYQGGVASQGYANASIRPQPQSEVGDNALLTLGSVLGRFLDESKEKQKQVNTQQVINQYREAKLEALYGDDGIYTKQGQEFIDAVPETIARLHELQTQLGSSGNIDRGVVNNFFTEDNLKSTASLRKASIKAEFEIEKATTQAERSLLTNEAMQDPTLFFENASKIEDNVEQFLSQNGIAVTENNTMAALSTYANSVISHAIDTDQLEAASIMLSGDLDISASVRTALLQKLSDAAHEKTVGILSFQAFEIYQGGGDPIEFIKDNAGGYEQVYDALKKFHEYNIVESKIIRDSERRFRFQEAQAKKAEEEEHKNLMNTLYSRLLDGSIAQDWNAIYEHYSPSDFSESDRDNIQQFMKRLVKDDFSPRHPLYAKYAMFMNDSDARRNATQAQLDEVIQGIPIEYSQKLVSEVNKDERAQDSFVRSSIGKRVNAKIKALGLSGNKYAKERGVMVNEFYEKADGIDINSSSEVTALLEEVFNPERIKTVIEDVKTEDDNPAFAPTVPQFLADGIASREIEDKKVAGVARDMFREELARSGLGKKPSYNNMNRIWEAIVDTSYSYTWWGGQRTLAEIYADASKDQITKAKEELQQLGVANPSKGRIARHLAGAD